MPAPLLARSPRDRIRTRPRLGCARSDCMAERPQGLLLPGRPPACSWSHKSRSLRASRVSRVDRWRCVCVSRSAERKTGSGSPLLGLPESLADWTALEVLVCVADATSLLRLFRSSMARTSVVHLVNLSRDSPSGTTGRPINSRASSSALEQRSVWLAESAGKDVQQISQRKLPWCRTCQTRVNDIGSGCWCKRDRAI